MQTTQHRQVYARLAYAIRQGWVEPEACADCGDPVARAHLPDLTKPRLVVWLCAGCLRAQAKHDEPGQLTLAF